MVESVVDRVESLEENHAEDEAEIYWLVGFTKVINNQINCTVNTVSGIVKRTRPELSVRSNFKFDLIKTEERDEYDYTLLVNDP